MRLTTIAMRIDAVAQRIPHPEALADYDLSLLSDDERKVMQQFAARIVAVGAPTDIRTLASLFNPVERNRIDELFFKAEMRTQSASFTGAWQR